MSLRVRCLLLNCFRLLSLSILMLTWHTPVVGAPEMERLAGVAPKARITAPIDESTRVTLAGHRHPQAVDANDIGAAADSLRLDRIILTLKADAGQNAALDTFLREIRDPASPQYRRWLTAQGFEQHFGVAPSDIAKVSQWLRQQGFNIDEIPPGRRAILFSGTVAQVRRAFHTEIRRYRHTDQLHLANAGEPQIPRALADVVDGIVSLHDFHSRPLHLRQQPAPNYSNGSTHYLAPGDFHTIYNLKPIYAQSIKGNGQSIAILGRSNVSIADIQKFRSSMNLPASAPQIIVNGADPGYVSGDEGESDLDLEWAGAVAPAATIKFVTSQSTTSTDGIALSAQYAVSNNVADVISLSYGQCEANLGRSGTNFYSNLWQQAVAQGMTVVVSSGDSGAAGCDSASATTATHGRGVNGLCSSIYSTCVGGTQFADTANPSLYWASSNNADSSSALSYIPETVWNESAANGGSALWASGGGASLYYSKPSWQNTPGVPADGKRDVPDVSLNAAAHDGYFVYSSDNSTRAQTLYVFAGTSAAAPAFAGIVALINQKTGYRQGNANPTLYALASLQNGGGAAYFHRITSGNNSVPGVSGFAASTSSPAYNQASGLGSIDGNVLIGHWTDALPTSSTSVASNCNPCNPGQSVTFTASVSGSAPGGSVQFTDNGANLGTAVTLAAAKASLSTGALASGSHSIAAVYSGDVNNKASTSATLTQTILTASSVALSTTPASLAAGQSIALTASVSGASPGGTVQFIDGSSNLGAAVALSAGTATLNTNALTTAGNHSISASYSGDAANTASVSASLTVNVTPAISSVSLSSSAGTINVGQSLTLTATVSGVAPTGTVTFKDGGNSLGSTTLSAGSASLATTALSAGSHSLTAVYSGDANNLASTSPVLGATVNQAISQSDGDVPTLPEWGVIVLGTLLLRAALHRRQQPTAG